jgi:indole-3-glycerol phosphate synthase
MEHRSSGLAVIAEVKRRSPSKGWLNEHLDAGELAQQYEKGGACALSVLTDENFFSGSIDDLQAVHTSSDLPILRKDFTLSENDIVDAVEMGASCVLLIVAALSADELHSLLDVANGLRIDALVEVHTSKEAELALEAGASIIGVNQRDLHSFQVDAERARAVVASLNAGVLAVAESGFASPRAAERAAQAGFDAILVGEAFVRAGNVEDTVRAFSGFPIGTRAT